MSTTPNLGLTLPTRGTLDWDTPLNGNFSIIDSVLGGARIIDNEIPVGTINGTTGSDGNTDFTIVHLPNPVTSIHLTKNGQEVYVGVAFTFDGPSQTITYLATFIPVTGDVHRVSYRY